MGTTSEKLLSAITELYKMKEKNLRQQQPLSVDSLALYLHCSCDDILFYAGQLESEDKITILEARIPINFSKQRRRRGIAQIVLR